MTTSTKLSQLAGLASLAIASTLFAQNAEVEPNESKSAATNAFGASGTGLVNGETLTGFTTGVSLTTPGDGSADYFRVKTAPADVGIYRHRLVITTSTTTKHGATIRGVQSNGTGDASIQFNAQGTTPSRFNQWYGFGRSEELYYRVTGSGTTTAPYTATYSVEPVNFIAIVGAVSPGPITITTVGRTTDDTDFWVYDENFNPIATFGNDDATIAGGGPAGSIQSIATRSLTPGVYYMGISRFNFANNQPSPSDEAAADEFLDFPNIAVASDTATGTANLSFSIVSGSATRQVSLATNGPYEVAWVSFEVGSDAQLGGTATAIPNVVGIVPLAPDVASTSTVLEVSVSPAGSPPSTGITVSGNLSELGLGTNIAFFDNGTNGDRIANDRIFSLRVTPAAGTPTGVRQWGARITDAQARATNVVSTLQLRRPLIELGEITPLTAGEVPLTVLAGEITWARLSVPCQVDDMVANFLDITTTAGSAVDDTEIALYDNAGSVVAADDDDGVGNKSLLTFGAGSLLDVDGSESNAVADGRDGNLAAPATYFLAVGAFNSSFGPAFAASSTATATGQVQVLLSTNAACTPDQCDGIDFNGDGLFPADEDLVDFLVVLAGGTCSNDPNCSDIDFNNDGLFPSDDDLVAFLRVLAGGSCS